MAIYKILLCAGWLIALTAFAEAKIDKKDTINGVKVTSAKDDDTRTYSGQITKKFPHPIESVKSGIVNFDEKCNNDYKERRNFTDKKADCKYHNDHLVETLVVKDLKDGWTKDANEVERYILGRQIYNRGSFGYYEMVKVFEAKNAQNQRTITIVQTMMSDKQVKKYTKPAFEKDSAFDDSMSIFTLTETAPNETTMEYTYQASTEHFILNKEISVPQVFASISKSINDLIKTVATESALKSRDVASN